MTWPFADRLPPQWQLTSGRGRLLLLVPAAALLAVSIGLSILTIAAMLSGAGGHPSDWNVLVQAGRLIGSGGNPYDAHEAHDAFRWSPLAAYLMIPISAIGFWGWAALHGAALGLLRDWRIITLTLLLWPFWVDVGVGNAMTFVFVAAWFAWRGSRIGTGAFLLLSFLMPRPLVIPLVVWILFKRPEWRLPATALFALHGMGVWATGWAAEWIARLTQSAGDVAIAANMAPSAWIGPLWIAIGVPLAVWLFSQGRIGFASLAISPYWLPQYLMLALIELARPERANRTAPPSPAEASATAPT